MASTEAPALDVRSVRTPGLGDSTYIVINDGVAVLVDPQRDVDRFLPHFDDAGVELRWILETHLHNDYVSGGLEASRLTGAELVMPAAAAPVYRHTPAFHMEDLGDDSFAIRPIHTPGHTPEHTSYLLVLGGEPVALFSGGSLLVGSAGRPDLLGSERADTLARLQYRSITRLANLPDEVGLYPTHGEGSFCTVSSAGRHTSTIGAEKRTNPVLAYPDEETFVKGQLTGLQPFPVYYAHMGPANLRGGEPMPSPDTPVLDAATVAGWGDEVTVVDARDRHRFAAGHIPGSIGVELRDEFGTWVGWLVDIDQPIVLVADPDQDLGEALTQLARIGFVQVRGALIGLDEWREAGYETNSHQIVNVAQFAQAAQAGASILDVRAPAEFEGQRIAGSLHRYLPDIVEGVPEIPGGSDVYVACESGFRATIAAGMLERQGHNPLVLADGGIADICSPRPDNEWNALCEPPLQVG